MGLRIGLVHEGVGKFMCQCRQLLAVGQFIVDRDAVVARAVKALYQSMTLDAITQHDGVSRELVRQLGSKGSPRFTEALL